MNRLPIERHDFEENAQRLLLLQTYLFSGGNSKGDVDWWRSHADLRSARSCTNRTSIASDYREMMVIDALKLLHSPRSFIPLDGMRELLYSAYQPLAC